MNGDLVTCCLKKFSNAKVDMYEIDTTIKLLNPIKSSCVIYGDFITQQINKKYHTIVGNPPYVRTKTGNLYIDFTLKCVNLLHDDGELIFIVPSDFFKLTSAASCCDYMMKHGTFTHIFHPHNEKLFKNASIDVVVFRYCKNNLLVKTTLYNGELKYITNTHGLITFNNNLVTNKVLFKEYFDVYVGMVSGKESVFKNQQFGNIEVLTNQNQKDKYIFITKYPCENENINKILLENKKVLLSRKIKKFDSQNWFEWGAPRNITSINKYQGNKCIYIFNLTRHHDVAFQATIQYFGANLLMLRPKKSCNLTRITEYLNHDTFKKNFIFSGRFKLGHRQLSNSIIPIEYL